MSRYIDADDAMERIKQAYEDMGVDTHGVWNKQLAEIFKVADVEDVRMCLHKILGAVSQAPSIDIVRCGECKYWKSTVQMPNGTDVKCLYGRKADDFCSYGEQFGKTEQLKGGRVMTDLERIKKDVVEMDSRANIRWYDTKVLTKAVRLILEELTADRKTENSSVFPNNCEPQTERKCIDCNFLTYMFGKTWCKIKCENPHDKVCDRFKPKDEPQTERSSE